MDIKDREKLVAAFDHMVENVAHAVHEAEEALEPTVEEMVHNAAELARELYSLSQEEAEGLADTLKRDIGKANRVLNRQRKEFKDWLSFDLAVAEDRFADLISRAADKTWLDFHKFEYEDHQASLYRSGEICSAGTFSCNACDSRIQLPASGQVPRCPECDNDQFYRVIS